MGLRLLHVEAVGAAATKFFGALAFICGTLYTVADRARARGAGQPRHRPVHHPGRAAAGCKRPIVYVLDLLAVIPSVVFGLWGVLVLRRSIMGSTASSTTLRRRSARRRRLRTAAIGRSFLTAGIILAIMITPIITSLAREVIDTRRPTDREAALALGATRWEMIRGAVLPHCKGGLVGAVMLGLGRAMGETIAVALVIGSSAADHGQPVRLGRRDAGGDRQRVGRGRRASSKSALDRARRCTLFVITIVVNLVATSIVQRSMREAQAA